MFLTFLYFVRWVEAWGFHLAKAGVWHEKKSGQGRQVAREAKCPMGHVDQGGKWPREQSGKKGKWLRDILPRCVGGWGGSGQGADR